MNSIRRYALTGLLGLIFLSLTISGALPSVSLGTDQANDVEKINGSGLPYEYEQGDFKNEIDIVSIAVEEVASDIKISVTFEGTPVIDATHLYWIWISFLDEGGEDSDAGAWFHTGGFSGTAESFWMVAKNVTDFMNIGTGDDDPTIVSNTMSWSTSSTYWDDISNSNNWDVGVWAWTSDNATYVESIMSGFSYWDYYPNDESAWEGESDSSTTTTESETEPNGNGTPGFELIVTFTSLAIVPVILRKRR